MLGDLFARLAKMGARQLVLLTIVTGSVVAGAGFGVVDTLTDDDPVERAGTPTTTPTPPDPTVTTRSTATPTTAERTAETTTTANAGVGAVNPPPSTARTTTAETTTTTRPAEPNATLALSASDPPAVRNDDGAVERVAGTLTGTLDWNAESNVTRVALVVQTWTPDSEWRESTRVTVAPNGTNLAVESVLDGSERVYAAGDRASEFDVGDDGANVTREGYVAATAVLFGTNGTELERASAVDEYALKVSNEQTEATEEVSALGSSGGGDPSLRLAGDREDPTVLDVSDVAPGRSGDDRISITNDGDDAGVFRASVANVSDRENGLTEPERAVDGSPSAGELADALDVRIAFEDETGDAVGYLAGDASTFVPLGSQSVEDLTAETSLSTDETVHLVVEWRVDAEVGNEIQSDAVVLDFGFTIVDEESAQRLGSPPGALLGDDSSGVFLRDDPAVAGAVGSSQVSGVSREVAQ